MTEVVFQKQDTAPFPKPWLTLVQTGNEDHGLFVDLIFHGKDSMGRWIEVYHDAYIIHDGGTVVITAITPKGDAYLKEASA